MPGPHTAVRFAFLGKDSRLGPTGEKSIEDLRANFPRQGSGWFRLVQVVLK